MLEERTSSRGLHEHVIKLIGRMAKDRNAKILDVGCGSGSLLAKLRELGYSELMGVDIDPPKNLPGIELRAIDFDSFGSELSGCAFDVIVAVEVVEHVENVGSFIDALVMALKPGGGILFTTPNVHSVEARLRFFLSNRLKQFDEKGDPTHIAPIFVYSFSALLRRRGLKIVDVSGYPEDGLSPTSRPALRMLSKLMALLGIKGEPAGDNLVLRIQSVGDPVVDKKILVTGHYGRVG